jgi:hypothetical protein
MCSPAPPGFSLTLLSQDPYKWAFAIYAAVMSAIAVYMVFRRTNPGRQRQVYLTLWICIGLFFTASIFMSTVVMSGFEGAFNSWLLAAMNAPGRICSSDGLDKAISSHNVISDQLTSISTNLGGAAIALVAIYLIILYVTLEARGRRQAAS